MPSRLASAPVGRREGETRLPSCGHASGSDRTEVRPHCSGRPTGSSSTSFEFFGRDRPAGQPCSSLSRISASNSPPGISAGRASRAARSGRARMRSRRTVGATTVARAATRRMILSEVSPQENAAAFLRLGVVGDEAEPALTLVQVMGRRPIETRTFRRRHELLAKKTLDCNRPTSLTLEAAPAQDRQKKGDRKWRQ